MFVDITGKKRLKAGFHTHTTNSDGRLTPDKAIALYAAAGYDILAITDHWKYAPTRQVGDMTVLSGCEYDISGPEQAGGITETYHVVALGMTRDPEVPVSLKNDPTIPVSQRVKTVVRMIREAGGTAVLAHPAWSLNTVEQILRSGDFDATEIYNSVSEHGMSDRPYSGLIADMLASLGVYLPLLATDDTHYYDGDQTRGITMLEADAVAELGLAGAIREKRFYATQGPEIHLERISETQIKLTCSPAVKIAFFSNVPWCAGRIFRGEDLTEAIYEIKFAQKERFVRAEVTDAEGRVAWSNIIPVEA